MSFLENFNDSEKVEKPEKNLDVPSKIEKTKDTVKPNEFSHLEPVQEEDNPEEWQNGTPLDGAGGAWDGTRGDSEWIPNPDAVPQNPLFNPDQNTNAEIFADYPQDGVTFIKGEPDFSPFAVDTVKIEHFSGDRYLAGGNFDQATKIFAEDMGMSVKEAKEYIKDNHLTWHERSDCQTMDLVRTDIHGCVRHSGGISAYKSQHNLEE